MCSDDFHLDSLPDSLYDISIGHIIYNSTYGGNFMGVFKAYRAYKEIKRDVQTVSKMVYGTTDLSEALQKSANEPEAIKSISGMTNIYLPMIAEDFPDFNLEEFKNRTSSLLTSALLAITQEDVSYMVHASDNLQETIRLRIHNNQISGIKESYTNIKTHRIEISRYKKVSGTCVITLQCSIEYLYTKYQNGKLIKGNDKKLDQSKYDLQLIYIQDVEKLQGTSGNIFNAISCPNCGGNMTELGTKVCAYCGSTLEEINIKAWEIDTFKEY